MDVPGLGKVTKDDEELGWYYSDPIAVPMLGGMMCRIVLEGYDDEPEPRDFHVAIANFLSAGPDVLRRADDALWQYYEDCAEHWEGAEDARIETADDLWRHVQLGTEPMVTRRQRGDRAVYVSIECGCAWEVEHGLQIVLRNGLEVNKLGMYDGHLTNSDAFADPALEDTIYR